ncbi:MAG: hypothetical protein J6U17_04640 [Kiritimatiellae bacterium]|nr:hypothetical protein [Kiritimatiellia bacterium]
MLEKAVNWHRKRRCECVVAAILAIAVCGCTDDSDASAQAAAEPRQEVVVPPRHEDPEYNARLQESVSERRALMSEMEKVRAEYEAAKESDPEGERVKELSAKMDECDAKLKDQRARATALVRGRIWKEFHDKDKAREAAQEAGAEK